MKDEGYEDIAEHARQIEMIIKEMTPEEYSVFEQMNDMFYTERVLSCMTCYQDNLKFAKFMAE